MPEDYDERDEFADGYPLLLSAGHRPGGPARRRGLLIATAIAVVAAAAGFGVVEVATVIMAAVTRATTISGKVTSIGGIKVGDLVSVAITGANGKLTADSIQDPASLPSASSQ